MITFVLYDDIKEFRDRAEEIINQLMKKEGRFAQIESYGSYNEEFKKTIEKKDIPKIYILDIDVPNSESGIDIAKRIRKTDWNSIIILVTCHEEMGQEALKAKIMLLDFISKYNDWEGNLKRTVKEAIQKIGTNNILVLENGTMTYRIYASDVLYILKDSVDRKCIVKTSEHEIPVNKTMVGISKMLDERFYLSHRSCYINLEQIEGVDWKKNTIYFPHGEKIDYLSRDRKKGLKEYVRSS